MLSEFWPTPALSGVPNLASQLKRMDIDQQGRDLPRTVLARQSAPMATASKYAKASHPTKIFIGLLLDGTSKTEGSALQVRMLDAPGSDWRL
jgi:hypothetical protein